MGHWRATWISCVSMDGCELSNISDWFGSKGYVFSVDRQFMYPGIPRLLRFNAQNVCFYEQAGTSMSPARITWSKVSCVRVTPTRVTAPVSTAAFRDTRNAGEACRRDGATKWIVEVPFLDATESARDMPPRHALKPGSPFPTPDANTCVWKSSASFNHRYRRSRNAVISSPRNAGWWQIPMPERVEFRPLYFRISP